MFKVLNILKLIYFEYLYIFILIENKIVIVIIKLIWLV